MRSSQKSARRDIARRVLVLAVGAVALPVLAAGPKGTKPGKTPTPIAHLALADLGVPKIAPAFINAGASMLTVHALDSTHLLVTYATRQLVPRVAGESVNDEARIVAGEVVEVPSGKILAHAEWRMRDHGRYLWSIGRGLFVLRMGENLSLMAPLKNLADDKAFARIALPHQAGMPVAVQGSPDGEILSVVSEFKPKTEKPKVVVVGDPEEKHEKPVYAIDFFRLEGDGTDGAPYNVKGAGAVKAPAAMLLPLDADGYLWAVDDQKTHWAVTFNSFEGKVIPAGTIDSSCPPRLRMVSRSEYIALTCRGNDAAPKLQAMGLDGHETWEEPFSEFTQVPEFQFAPSAGRFAMLRTGATTTDPSATGGGPNAPIVSNNQEVRVYQTESGDLLLKVSTSPTFRVPENFAMSEDGRMIAVIRGEAIDVYGLPAPSKRDMQDLAEVEQFRPPVSHGPVTLTRLTQPAPREPEVAVAAAVAATEAPVATTTRAEIPVAANTEGNLGDAQGPRKRPTLLNPGEVPEFKDKKAPAQ